MHTEKFLARLRREDEVSKLHQILLNIQQRLVGAEGFIFKVNYM